MQKRFALFAAFLVSGLLLLGVLAYLPFVYATTGDPPVFWSKAGSVYEWENPQYEQIQHAAALYGCLVADNIYTYDTYKTGAFGNGTEASGEDGYPEHKWENATDYVLVDQSLFNMDAGAICFWVRPWYYDHYEEMYYWAMPGLVRIYGEWYNPYVEEWMPTCLLLIQLPEGLGGITVESYLGNFGASYEFEWGELYHVAFVWDKDGIDSSDDVARIYINGTLEGYTGSAPADISGYRLNDGGWLGDPEPPTWYPDIFWEDLTFLSTGTSFESPAGSSHQIDDVMIFDYAHTDYSDYETEGLDY